MIFVVASNNKLTLYINFFAMIFRYIQESYIIKKLSRVLLRVCLVFGSMGFVRGRVYV